MTLLHQDDNYITKTHSEKKKKNRSIFKNSEAFFQSSVIFFYDAYTVATSAVLKMCPFLFTVCHERKWMFSFPGSGRDNGHGAGMGEVSVKDVSFYEFAYEDASDSSKTVGVLAYSAAFGFQLSPCNGSNCCHLKRH